MAGGRTCASASIERAHVGERGAGGGFPVLLDGKPVKTPARRALAAPTRALAEAIAQEWKAQAAVIDPARMPLTRLANAVIDAVAEQGRAGGRRGGEISRLRSVVLSRRGAGRPGRAAGASLGPGAGLGAPGARRALRADRGRDVCRPAARGDRGGARGDPGRPMAAGRGRSDHHADRLGAAGAGAGADAIDVDAAWAAAHVDEDWQMEHWGRDDVRARPPRLSFCRDAGGGDGVAECGWTCRELRFQSPPFFAHRRGDALPPRTPAPMARSAACRNNRMLG